MAIDLVALRAELTNDPAGMGYAPFLAEGAFTPIVSLLNGAKSGSLLRGLVAAWEIAGSIERTEWAAITAADRAYIQMLLSAGSVNVASQRVQDAFANAFGVGSATRAALVALLRQPGTRAEILFGLGTVVTADDVARAWRV